MLALIMVLALVPTVAFAAEPKKIYVDVTNGDDNQKDVGTTREKAYQSLDKAMDVADDGATIYLAEGTYCGNSDKPSEEGKGAGKSLTFVGAGSDKTTWQIRATKEYGSDGWCDYSFKNSDNITFENMTVIGSVYLDTSIKNNDTQGLTYINHLTLKDCIFNGRADYWGYKTTTFENVTFNAPGTEASEIEDVDYSLWTKTGREYTFDHCTFNSAGKVINAYREGTTSAADNPIVLNFKDCNVVSSDPNKSVLNIKDANNYYTVNISGTNTVEGLKPNKRTCSRLFQVEGNKATVKIDNITVWENGSMVSHAIDTDNDQYTDGYKDNKFEIIKDTTTGGYVKKCIYCDYMEPFYGELSNEIGLKRIVKQNNGVVSEDSPSSNKYKVANTSGITVDYTATMNMENLKWEKQGSLYDDRFTPWQMLTAQPGWITEDTVVFLNFKFDNIDLKAFKDKYDAGQNVLELTSDMFKIADEGGVQFNTAKGTMTIKCKWKEDASTNNSTITLKGHGLPVTNDWNGSKIDIKNSGCVSGTVHIKNPGTEKKVAMAEIGPNVAVNQVSSATPSLDTIQIPIVGGCKTDEFTLYYGGGGSGDSGHSYYYPTATPVPVIVIPPKTGDMTIWQSILHFLGIK